MPLTEPELLRFETQKKARIDRLKGLIKEAKKLTGWEKSLAVDHIKKYYQSKQERKIIAKSGI